jgi:dimethylhistidine N-methyltransferase
MMARPNPAVLPLEHTGFGSDVAEYLQRTPRQLPSRYLYDALGSALFDAICHLPWYRVTRAETALLERYGSEMLAGDREPLDIAELGGGNGDKLAVLLDRSDADIRRVHLIDISETALDHARDRVAASHGTSISTFQGTYEEGLEHLPSRDGDGTWVVLFLGSNIGNFDPPVARDLLRRIRRAVGDGGALLLGTDLVKPTRDLLLAYDDPLQVTAAFNRNLLQRINEELGGTFDLDSFAHRAIWNGHASRVEMHLVCRRSQIVRIDAVDLELTFDEGDWIWTESSYKWRPETVIAEGTAAGFRSARQWIDRDAGFAVTRFIA